MILVDRMIREVAPPSDGGSSGTIVLVVAVLAAVLIIGVGLLRNSRRK